MGNKLTRVHSDLPIPPGEFLVEELAARGIAQRELAARMGRPYRVISEIADAKKAITPDAAIRLGTVLGHDPRYWINLENTYQLALVRQRERERQNSRN